MKDYVFIKFMEIDENTNNHTNFKNCIFEKFIFVK